MQENRAATKVIDFSYCIMLLLTLLLGRGAVEVTVSFPVGLPYVGVVKPDGAFFQGSS